MTIIVDSREQAPFAFEHDRFMDSQWTTKSKQLHAIGGFCLQLVVNQWSSGGQIVSRKIKYHD